MTTSGMLQVAIYFTVLIAAAVPLGRYMAQVYSGEAVFLSRLAGPLERGIYRCCRIDAEQEMDWKAYAGGLLIFSLTGCLACICCSGSRDSCRSIPRASPPFPPIWPSIPPSAL